MNHRQETSQHDPEWTMRTCPRCQREFKTPADKPESGVCPRCMVVLDPGKAVDARRDARKRHALIRTHREKKKADPEEPDWEADSDSSETALSESTEREVAEFYEQHPTKDGIRRTKISKKKLPTIWENLTRSAKIGIILFVLGVTGIVIAVVTVRSIEVARKDVAEFGKPTETRDIDAEVASVMVTEPEKQACLAVLKSFLAAPSITEKLRFVRVPERVKPLIEAWPADDALDAVTTIAYTEKTRLDGRTFILLAAKLNTDDGVAQHRFLAFEKTDAGILLDWEVSFRHRPMPLDAFKRTRPTDPIPFRVKMNRGSEYQPPFHDEEKFQCVELTSPGDRGFRLVGYVDRHSVWGASLVAGLEFEAPSVILNLRYPEHPQSDIHVEITGVEHDSWYY